MYSGLNTYNYKIGKNNNNFFYLKTSPNYGNSLSPKRGHIKASYKIWSELARDTLLEEGEYPCIFLAYRKNISWELFCEQDSYNLGLCSIDPIKGLSIELKTFKSLTNLCKTRKCFPIHINITIHTGGNKFTHANSLIIFRRSVFLFEPCGNLNSKFPSLQNKINNNLTQLCRRVGLQYSGLLLPRCNFQSFDDTLCYLWALWLEFHILLNPKASIDKIRNFFKGEYLRYINNPKNRDKMIQFDQYLNELISK